MGRPSWPAEYLDIENRCNRQPEPGPAQWQWHHQLRAGWGWALLPWRQRVQRLHLRASRAGSASECSSDDHRGAARSECSGCTADDTAPCGRGHYLHKGQFRAHATAQFFVRCGANRRVRRHAGEHVRHVHGCPRHSRHKPQWCPHQRAARPGLFIAWRVGPLPPWWPHAALTSRRIRRPRRPVDHLFLGGSMSNADGYRWKRFRGQ